MRGQTNKHVRGHADRPRPLTTDGRRPQPPVWPTLRFLVVTYPADDDGPGPSGVAFCGGKEVNAVCNDISALNDPLAQELLGSPVAARLAYNGLDGLPRVVPVGFLWTGGRLVICTATTAPKVRALRARPEVAITIDRQGPPAQALFVRGRTDIDIVEGVPDEYIAASRKSGEGPDADEFERQVRKVYPAMARLSVEPTWARLYDFGTGRLPGFLQDLVGLAG